MVRVAFSRSRRSLSIRAHVKATPHPTAQTDQLPDGLPLNTPSLTNKLDAPQKPRMPFDPKAIFHAFLEKVPPPPGLPDTPEAVETLKKKGIELRNRLAALEPLKGTQAWTTDQEAKYYFMDFQRKWIFCRCLRFNQLVSVTDNRHRGRSLIFIAAHRDHSANLPHRFVVIHRHAVAFTLPTPSDVGLPEVEVHGYRGHDSVEHYLVQGSVPIRTILRLL